MSNKENKDLKNGDKTSEEVILNKFNKIKGFMTSKAFSAIILILSVLIIITFIIMFITGNRDQGDKASENVKYTTNQDERFKILVQDSVNYKLSTMAEIQNIMSKEDLRHNKQKEFLKDIKQDIINENNLFIEETDKIGSLSQNARLDKESNKNMSTYMLEYIDDLMVINEKNKDNNEYIDMNDYENLLESSSKIYKVSSNTKYDSE